MKRLALLLPLLALAAVGCRKTTFTPDVVPASIQSYHQDPDGRLTLKIKCDSATAKGRAFLCSTKPAKGKGEPLASVRFQFYERGNIPGSEQLTLDADGTTEYSVDIDKLNAALAGIPEQARPADRILHVFINQTEVGQWNLESPPATNAPVASEPHAESAEPEPHAETAEPEPHAESADSPLATALAGGEWIPLVVESVYIDATAPRELRKNWIVSFSGGIKARVHSPVKTFGESYGDLPGKRFGVRFVDRAAALAALHGTVYSGELEVRSAQGPVSAAANAAAEKEAAVRAKLDAIVFDSLEYQDANAADVISDLCERAREMDKDEPDPAKKGVSVVVGVDVKDIDEILARTTVTLKERSVSLGAALDRVADAIGLKVRVVGGCVLLGIYKGPLECRIFPVPPDLASRFLGDGNDWKARFAEIGIEWPDGTYVRYLMSVGRLTVYNTPDDLDRIERALAEAAPSPAEERYAESGEPGGGSGEAQPPPVESHAESAEGAE